MAQNNCIGTIPEMRLSASTTMSLTWRGWLLDGTRLLAASLVRAWGTVRFWRQRAQGRSDLAHLDDRMLEDIGMTREQANREMRKPFWKA